MRVARNDSQLSDEISHSRTFKICEELLRAKLGHRDFSSLFSNDKLANLQANLRKKLKKLDLNSLDRHTGNFVEMLDFNI